MAKNLASDETAPIAAQLEDFALPRLPVLSEMAKARGIGIIGAGWITDVAHLPAYEAIGAKVVGLNDIEPNRSADLCGRHGIRNAYSTLDALLSDDSIEVVDIAVPPRIQEDIATRVIESGRHVLCQKPLAMSSAEGQRLAELGAKHNVTVGVNVNMRWAPAIRALKSLNEQKAFGDVTGISVVTTFWDSWEMWPWLHTFDRLMIRQNAIHLLDWLRHIFGDAESIFASASHRSDAVVQGETNVVIVLRFPSGFTAYIHDSADDWTGDVKQEFRVEGTAMHAIGTLGLWDRYPPGRGDTLKCCARSEPGVWRDQQLPGQWACDAFAWTMGELMTAIDEHRTPVHNPFDHVRTLQYVEAAYESIETRCAVDL